jgi:hypothetical protein
VIGSPTGCRTKEHTVFRYLALACFACAVTVLLMKRVRAKKGAPVMAH